MTMPAPAIPSPARPANLSRRILVGWAIVGVMLACAGVFWAAADLVSTFKPSSRLAAEVEYPATVKVGERFKLVLRLTNRSEADLKVGDIDLSPAPASEHDSVLAGARVESTIPSMESTGYPSMKLRSFHYNRVIQAGDTDTVVFYLRAVQPGEFHTSIDTYLEDETVVIWDFGNTIVP